MGLTVTEQLELGVGITIESYYISLNENEISIKRKQEREYVRTEDGGDQEVLHAPKFHVEADFTIWVSKAAKDVANSYSERKRITLELDTAPTDNIYELLYTKLKEGLTNYVDA